ncbi:hypothetical protein DICPUDRAFT_93893 [Dictyostelium purpureum]|uniref:Repressor of RNA polymerase III transcription n=1 Tax=Dictyostelium purpureum TaxID=5786 RepID=F0ZD10_DICPU|nr:uncharacterized protein DICPUDRAFT_93893 [Dictyostelium purpureum]EGC38161.1 hypothetical protein DICPUDRAFT_93893 [Dictyostelium purpureum]|eukprot:XP_003285288.1 hypothetical protein DICPUDRAFT_93893 [Dictyostelium purpureum]
MKYIDSLNLIGLNSYLNMIDVGDAFLMGDLEEYSCKIAGSDKKIYKSLDKELEELSSTPQQSSLATSASPSSSSMLSVSPFGPLSSSTSRKTMIYLIQTLNASFPDYDFSDSKPEQFRKEPSLNLVINSINATLSGYIKDYFAEFEAKLWSTLETEISLQKCDIYSYIPENGDPFTEAGVLYSFNYFFYNRSLKKIVFFKCRYISKLPILDNMDTNKEDLPDQEELDDDYYTEYYNDTVDGMEMN